MEYTVKQRLIAFIKFKGLSQLRFEKSIDAGNGFVNNIRKSIGADKSLIISKVYPDLNIDWLLTGEGEMLKNLSATPPVSEINIVPLLPVSAIGGSLNDFIVSVMPEDCEKIVSPIKGVDFAISVTGDSMAPEYPSGSKILIKKIDEKAFIEWGRVYVLDTRNGSVIKKIMPGTNDDRVRCESLNPDYPSFEVCFSDMFGMYRVLMLLTEK